MGEGREERREGGGRREGEREGGRGHFVLGTLDGFVTLALLLIRVHTS